MNKQALIESVKEILRTALLAAIPVIIVSTENGSISLKAAGLAFVIAVLRGIEKYLHKAELKSLPF